ncbi:MAG TPA: hypothetical protein PLC65_17860, partial [Bacteroidia bacterium]|nr:hypothetical protein [Bacteroidia bacterium]
TGYIQLGKAPALPLIPCAASPGGPAFTIGLGGLAQVYDPNSSNTSLLNMQSWGGTNPGSSIDASLSGSGTTGLLINFFCKSNTYINTA